MEENEFIDIATSTIASIADAIDRADIDCECEIKGDGILEVEFDDGAKAIVNRNVPVREIWLAAASGGFHFRFVEGQWIDTREGTELVRKLSEVLGKMAGREISLGPL